MTAIASGWMIKSWASRRASSAAASAVAWSGYPIAIRSAMALTLPLDSLLPEWPGPSVDGAAGVPPGPHPPAGEFSALPGTITSGDAVRPPVDAFSGRVADEDADDQHGHARDDHCGHPGEPRKRPLAGLAQGRSRLSYCAHGASCRSAGIPGFMRGWRRGSP